MYILSVIFVFVLGLLLGFYPFFCFRCLVVYFFYFFVLVRGEKKKGGGRGSSLYVEV